MSNSKMSSMWVAYQHVRNEVGHVGHGNNSYQSVGAVVGSFVSI